MRSSPPAPTVEVLLVSYNTRELLEDCLRSLRAHQPPGDVDVRIAVCDNGSTDGSADLVSDRFPDVRLIRQPDNPGFARANNLLARGSSADFLLLLNPDTVFVEDVITPLMRVLLSDSRIVVVGPRLVFPDGRVQTSSEWFPDLRFELARLIQGTKLARLLRRWFDAEATVHATRQVSLIGSTAPRDTEFLWATCWLIRRADLPAGELFNPSFVTYDEDLDFCRRHRNRGRRIVYAPEVTLVHLGGQSSDPELKRRLERRGRARYYREHGGRTRSAAFLLLTALVGQAKRAASRWRAWTGRVPDSTRPAGQAQRR